MKMRKTLYLLAIMSIFIGLFPLSMMPVSAVSTIVAYPNASYDELSSIFTVKADNSNIDVTHFANHHYARFSFDGTIQLEVTVNETVNSLRISPLSAGISAVTTGNKFTFSIVSGQNMPNYYTIYVNNLAERLFIIADPLETNVPPSSGAGIFNITEAPYNADSTGATIVGNIIQQAIDNAGAAGGGTVYFPAGTYKIAQRLFVRSSNVHLYLEGGATIRSSPDKDDYPKSDYSEHVIDFLGPSISNPISNVSIRGRGMVDGSGYQIAGKVQVNGNYPNRRGSIWAENCTNYVAEGIVARDSMTWSFGLRNCEYGRIKNVKVLNFNDADALKVQSDGINIISSSHVSVEKNLVVTIDDAMCSKASTNNREMHDIVFINNVVLSRCAGMKAGMQTKGRMYDIWFIDNDVVECRRGVAVEKGQGEQQMYNINFIDSRVEKQWSVGTPNNRNIDILSATTSGTVININNISFEQSERSYIETRDNNRVSNINITNVTAAGTPLNSLSQFHSVKGNVSGVKFGTLAPHDYIGYYNNLSENLTRHKLEALSRKGIIKGTYNSPADLNGLFTKELAADALKTATGVKVSADPSTLDNSPITRAEMLGYISGIVSKLETFYSPSLKISLNAQAVVPNVNSAPNQQLTHLDAVEILHNVVDLINRSLAVLSANIMSSGGDFFPYKESAVIVETPGIKKLTASSSGSVESRFADVSQAVPSHTFTTPINAGGTTGIENALAITSNRKATTGDTGFAYSQVAYLQFNLNELTTEQRNNIRDISLDLTAFRNTNNNKSFDIYMLNPSNTSPYFNPNEKWYDAFEPTGAMEPGVPVLSGANMPNVAFGTTPNREYCLVYNPAPVAASAVSVPTSAIVGIADTRTDVPVKTTLNPLLRTAFKEWQDDYVTFMVIETNNTTNTGGTNLGIYARTAENTEDENGDAVVRKPQLTITYASAEVELISKPEALQSNGADAAFTISAAAVNDTIQYIEFFNNGVLAGTGSLLSGNNYQYTFTNVMAGTHTITAKVYGSGGLVSDEKFLGEFKVLNGTVPHVSITSHDNGAYYPPGSDLTLNATITDPDSMVTGFKFYNNNILLGELGTLTETGVNILPTANWRDLLSLFPDDGRISFSIGQSQLVSAPDGENNRSAVANVIGDLPAADGNGLYLSRSNSTPAYLRISLSSPETVEKLVITSGQYGTIGSYELRYHTEHPGTGTAAVTFPNGNHLVTVTGNTNQISTANFTPVTAQYFELKLNRASALSINHIQLFTSSLGGGYTITTPDINSYSVTIPSAVENYNIEAVAVMASEDDSEISDYACFTLSPTNAAFGKLVTPSLSNGSTGDPDSDATALTDGLLNNTRGANKWYLNENALNTAPYVTLDLEAKYKLTGTMLVSGNAETHSAIRLPGTASSYKIQYLDEAGEWQAAPCGADGVISGNLMRDSLVTFNSPIITNVLRFTILGSANTVGNPKNVAVREIMAFSQGMVVMPEVGTAVIDKTAKTVSFSIYNDGFYPYSLNATVIAAIFDNSGARLQSVAALPCNQMLTPAAYTVGSPRNHLTDPHNFSYNPGENGIILNLSGDLLNVNQDSKIKLFLWNDMEGMSPYPVSVLTPVWSEAEEDVEDGDGEYGI